MKRGAGFEWGVAACGVLRCGVCGRGGAGRGVRGQERAPPPHTSTLSTLVPLPMALARAPAATRASPLARPAARGRVVAVRAKGDGARVDRSKKTDVM